MRDFQSETLRQDLSKLGERAAERHEEDFLAIQQATKSNLKSGSEPVAQTPSLGDLGSQIGRIAVGCFKKVQQFPFYDMALESCKEMLNHVEASVNGKNPQQETGQRHSQARSAGQAGLCTPYPSLPSI